MDTIVVAIIVLVLIIMSALTMMVVVFQSANDLADSWQNMEAQSISISETKISASGNYSGGLIDIAVQNEGSTNLYDYPGWDVIIQYQSGNSSRSSYSVSHPPSPGEWAIEGIYMTGGLTEVFDPNILNPGEEMILSISPGMVIGDGETSRIVISTPNGATSQCFVTK